MVLFCLPMYPSKVWIARRHRCVCFHTQSFLVTSTLWPLRNTTVYSEKNEKEGGMWGMSIIVKTVFERYPYSDTNLTVPTQLSQTR